jgi:hypothetical protein
MNDRPFTQKIAALAPELWANYVRAVERERRQKYATHDRSAYYRARYKARKAAGLCKLCDNPSEKFVLCVFHRAAMSFRRDKRVREARCTTK